MDLYVILGLEHGATETEIKRAYRRLARRYHPDINPGDHTAEARFRQILEAYETLIDPQRRLRYDSGSPLPGGDQRKSGFEGFDFSGRAADHAATFGDLFALDAVWKIGGMTLRGRETIRETFARYMAYTGRTLMTFRTPIVDE